MTKFSISASRRSLKPNRSAVPPVNTIERTVWFWDEKYIDYEEQKQYVLTVRATDNGLGAMSDTAYITVQIDDVNEPPAITGAMVLLLLSLHQMEHCHVHHLSHHLCTVDHLQMQHYMYRSCFLSMIYISV